LGTIPKKGKAGAFSKPYRNMDVPVERAMDGMFSARLEMPLPFPVKIIERLPISNQESPCIIKE